MKKRGFVLTLIFCLSVITLGLSREARAQVEPFYKGKTIRIMVGSTGRSWPSMAAGSPRND